MDKLHSIEELLSAHFDGELSPKDRARLERELAEEPRLEERLRDHEALGGLLREGLERRADAIDFSAFTDEVMARLPATPAAPSFLERFQQAFRDFLVVRRFQAISLAAAAVLLLIVGPLLWDATSPAGDGPLLAGGMAQVISLDTPEHTDAMFFTTPSGTTVIYVQESP